MPPKRIEGEPFRAFGRSVFENPDDAAFDKFMARYREKEAARKPDGFYSEHKGTFSFSQLTYRSPGPIREASRAMVRVFDGSVIRWDSRTVMNRVLEQQVDPQSTFVRSLVASLDAPAAAESREVFGFLTGQVQAMDPEVIMHQPSMLSEWWGKISLFEEVYSLLRQKAVFERRAFNETDISSEMETFEHAIEAHMEQTNGAISRFDKSRLREFLLTHDRINDLGTLPRRSHKPKYAKPGKRPPKELYDLMEDARSETDTMEVFYMNTGNVAEGKWEEIAEGWTMQEIATSLAVMLDLRTTETAAKIVDTIDDALESDIPGVVVVEELSPEGLATFIHYDIAHNVDMKYQLRDRYSAEELEEFDEDLDRRLVFSRFTLPLEFAPVTSLQLFSFLGRELSADDFTTVLAQTQAAVIRRNTIPTTQNEWLLLLMLLRNDAGEGIGEQVEQFVGRNDFPHKPFQGVFLNQRPGSIYLSENGALRVADHDIAGAEQLYPSTFVAPVVPERAATQGTTLFVKQPTASHKGVDEQRSYKRRRDQARASQPQDAEPAVTAEAVPRRRRDIVLPEGETLEELGKKLTQEDLAIVAQAIDDYQQVGTHGTSPLRAKNREGQKLHKLRVNGKANGIRVILAEVDNKLQVDGIYYRGNAYRNLYTHY